MEIIGKILLIEDDEDQADLIRLTFEAEWHRAKDLHQARLLLDRYSFDAVIADLGLPDSQGLKTVSSVRHLSPAVPLVVFSAAVHDIGADAIYAAGADSVLSKDHLPMLRDAAYSAVAKRHRQNNQRRSKGVTHRLHREIVERLGTSYEFFSFIESECLDGLWYWDIETDEEWYSPAFVKALGYDPDEVDYHSDWWQKHIFPQDRKVALENFADHVKDVHHPYEQTVRYRHKSGKTVWVRCRGRLVRDETGAPIRLLGCHVDITDLKEAEERLRNSAMTDSLTGLPNERGFIEKFNESLIRARRQKTGLAFFYFDLDNFKRINDTHGHDGGNHVLCTLAERAKLELRELDIVARLHGDEFAIVAEGVAAPNAAYTVGNRLLKAISQPVSIGDVMQPMTVSIGVSLYPVHGETYEKLQKSADRAMMAAKASGKNTVHVSSGRDPHLSGPSQTRIEAELWDALRRDEFYFDFQPQRSLDDHSIHGFEALMRWTSKHSVPPDLFLPALLRIGAMHEITMWGLQAACDAIKQSGHRIALNMSPWQLERPHIVKHIREVLDESGIRPDLFEIEITEERLTPGDSRLINTVHAIASLGVGIVLDDFGKGFSSFGRLETFPFTKIKLDKSLLFRDGRITRSVRAIAQLAEDRGVDLVAEGIETQEQLKQLQKAGVTVGQGFLLGRPGPLDEHS